MAYLRSKSTGVRIKGSSDTVLRTTFVTEAYICDDGTIGVEWGDYEDSDPEQRQNEAGEFLWTGADGAEYADSDIELVDEDEEGDEDEDDEEGGDDA